MRYPKITIDLVKKLRRKGKTYGEINSYLGSKLPKSTLSEWCREVPLPVNYQERLAKLTQDNLKKAIVIAREIRKIKREELLKKIEVNNLPVSTKITDKDTAKIALAMLCLGEASKSGHGSSFNLGNSNPTIIVLFIKLLKYCFGLDASKFRCTVQCRADQDIQRLEKYWQKMTGIPATQFYKAQIDPRTTGKPTKNKDYHGVLRVDYLDSKIRLELESLSSLVYNIVSEWARSAVG